MTLINETAAPQMDRLDQKTAHPVAPAKAVHDQPSIADTGKVRLGAQGPVFRRSIATLDTGKVRIGAQRMIF